MRPAASSVIRNSWSGSRAAWRCCAQGPLGFRVEVAERVDLVPEELDAHRMALSGGKAVQDPAADGELAGLRHLADGAIPARRQGAQQRPPGARSVAGRAIRPRSRSAVRTDRPRERRRHRRHQDVRPARQESMERLHPPGARLQVVLALRQEGHRLAEEEGEVLGQRRRDLVAPAQHERACVRCQPARRPAPGRGPRRAGRRGRPPRGPADPRRVPRADIRAKQTVEA